MLRFELGYAVLKVSYIFYRGLPRDQLESLLIKRNGKGVLLTCKMANLCISPVQAGIMPLSTANSSFILLRLRRSMRLCAVFLAIFRPAALVALGCFFLPAAVVVAGPAALLALAAAAVALLAALLGAVAGVGSSCGRGFI